MTRPLAVVVNKSLMCRIAICGTTVHRSALWTAANQRVERVNLAMKSARYRYTSMVLAFLVTVAVSLPIRGAWAADPELLSEHTDWAVYTFDDPNVGKVCFAVSQPSSWEPQNLRRDPIFFLVTNWKSKKVQEEVSVITGYPYKKNSTTSIRIGSDKFSLFTKDDSAWVETRAQEDKLVSAMRRGATMTVVGTSWRGNVTTDQYSLKGVSAALDASRAACN